MPRLPSVCHHVTQLLQTSEYWVVVLGVDWDDKVQQKGQQKSTGSKTPNISVEYQLSLSLTPLRSANPGAWLKPRCSAGHGGSYPPASPHVADGMGFTH